MFCLFLARRGKAKCHSDKVSPEKFVTTMYFHILSLPNLFLLFILVLMGTRIYGLYDYVNDALRKIVKTTSPFMCQNRNNLTRTILGLKTINYNFSLRQLGGGGGGGRRGVWSQITEI